MKLPLKSLQYTVLLFFMLVKMTAQTTVATTYDSIIAESFEKDQQIRVELDSVLNSGNKNNQELADFFGRFGKIDLENQSIVLPIVDRYIAQEIDLTDTSLSHAFYIIQHADGKVQSKYAPFITTLFEKAIISNQEFAWFSDRLAVRGNKVQPYGFQVKNWAETGENFPYPISSKAEENSQKIDLGSSKAFLEENYMGDYFPQYLTGDEFLVFGHVKAEKDNCEIVVDASEQTAVNDKGFYVLKLNRKERPTVQVCMKIGGELIDCKTITLEDKDWEEVDFQLPLK
ncbi:hypothetical protein ACYSNM_12860 [Myroides sp. LJL116]